MDRNAPRRVRRSSRGLDEAVRRVEGALERNTPNLLAQYFFCGKPQWYGKPLKQRGFLPPQADIPRPAPASFRHDAAPAGHFGTYDRAPLEFSRSARKEPFSCAGGPAASVSLKYWALAEPSSEAAATRGWSTRKWKLTPLASRPCAAQRKK